jgi:hypothetical protein
VPTLLYAMAGRQTLVTKAASRLPPLLTSNVSTGGLKLYNIAHDTTSPTIKSRARASGARLGWIGSSRACEAMGRKWRNQCHLK